MSEDLNKILLKKSLKNKEIIKPLVWISMSIGCNIKYATSFKDPVKLISLTLVILSILGLGGQYYFIWENRSKSLLTYTDAICTSFQTWISISKLFHFAFTQHKFEKLVKMAQNTEILQNFEIFELNIFNKKHITEEIQGILHDSWLDIKRQLNFYIISVFGIVGWYYFSCLAVNIYNTYTYDSPTEFELLYPFQGAFPMWRDKGIQFPYYFITYIISGSETHISGMSAVSFAGLYIVTSLHTLALLKILRRLVVYSTTEDVLPQERVKYILAWAKLHQRIYEYFYEINSLYYIQSAPLFLCSMLVICLLIFQGSVGLGSDVDVVIKMVLYFSAAGFEVSMFCFNGQRLTSESERLPVALYNCKWYDENTEFKFIIRMMLMRTNRTLAIQVGGFTTMSLVTLLGIMRSSFSYCLLLREFNSE
ncbi:odorant receptor 63a-like [Lucilia sericata]|uniref:odorant receptor 63a-like n=1 Tax=Lucilia sericata TaxID=13632 RepID=UPI0018A81C0A|nr:odorant receptor 63a-like [Lucilia sericata]